MAENVLDTLVGAVAVDSAWGPPIYVDDPFHPSAPGTESALGKILRPKVTVYWRDGTTQVIAPYGEPGPSKWPFPVFALAGLAGLLVAGGYAWGRRRA
jgi:hypothetical protein